MYIIDINQKITTKEVLKISLYKRLNQQFNVDDFYIIDDISFEFYSQKKQNNYEKILEIINFFEINFPSIKYYGCLSNRVFNDYRINNLSNLKKEYVIDNNILYSMPVGENLRTENNKNLFNENHCFCYFVKEYENDHRSNFYRYWNSFYSRFMVDKQYGIGYNICFKNENLYDYLFWVKQIGGHYGKIVSCDDDVSDREINSKYIWDCISDFYGINGKSWKDVSDIMYEKCYLN